MSGRVLLTKRSKIIFRLSLVTLCRILLPRPSVWRHRTDPNPPPSVRSNCRWRILLPRPSAHFRFGLRPGHQAPSLVDGAFFFAPHRAHGCVSSFAFVETQRGGPYSRIGDRGHLLPQAALPSARASAWVAKASPIPSGEAFSFPSHIAYGHSTCGGLYDGAMVVGCAAMFLWPKFWGPGVLL
jgi:hypothetical protein